MYLQSFAMMGTDGSILIQTLKANGYLRLLPAFLVEKT